MFMDNILTYLDYLSMEDTHLKAIIYSLVIMLTEENNHLRRFACSWHTRSNTPRTSSCSEEIMNVQASIGSTASTMSAKGATTSNFGKPSLTVLIVCQWLL